MQPYFLPYIGYWQLINAVDKFVILDDVQYISRGWINRNKICINGDDKWITIPLEGANRNKSINEIKILPHSEWFPKLSRTVKYNYKSYKNYKEFYPIIEDILLYNDLKLINYLVNSINTILNYLDIDTNIFLSSEIDREKKLSGQDRIIYLCRQEKANLYINLPGGKNLYCHETFKNANLDLEFINVESSKLELNPKFKNLSILHLIMTFGKNLRHYL
jgi:hypothetical protein